MCRGRAQRASPANPFSSVLDTLFVSRDNTWRSPISKYALASPIILSSPWPPLCPTGATTDVRACSETFSLNIKCRASRRVYSRTLECIPVTRFDTTSIRSAVRSFVPSFVRSNLNPLKLLHAYPPRARERVSFTAKIVNGYLEGRLYGVSRIYIPLEKGEGWYRTRTCRVDQSKCTGGRNARAAARAILSLRGNDNTPGRICYCTKIQVCLSLSHPPSPSWNTNPTPEEYLD